MVSARGVLQPTAIFFYVLYSVSISAQPSDPDFSGMWSDPPASPESSFCFVGCVPEAFEYLSSMFEAPEHFDKSYAELAAMAVERQKELVEAVLTDEGRRTYPFDFVNNDSSRDCVPWGGALQMVAPHQMQISQYEDRIEILYAEWEALRVIPFGSAPATEGTGLSLLGSSVARYDGDALVVETSGLTPNLLFLGTEASSLSHSDQLRIVERYEKTQDGQRLELTATLVDPIMLEEPITIWKPWARAPDEEIYEYQCEI